MTDTPAQSEAETDTTIGVPVGGMEPSGRETLANALQTLNQHTPTSTTIGDSDSDSDSDSGGYVSPWIPTPLQRLWTDLDNGDLRPAIPTVGQLHNGHHLFYAGQVNCIVGEPGAGKTWLANKIAADHMNQGYPVIYVDYESSPRTLLPRLERLGLQVHRRHLLTYYNANNPLDEYGLTAMRLTVENSAAPVLCVIDSVGRSLSAEGADSNDATNVDKWFAVFPEALAALGACVLLIDHTSKAGRGDRYAAGSYRKLANISGVNFRLETVNPFDTQRAGSSSLVCTKDREGVHGLDVTVANMLVNPDQDTPSGFMKLIAVNLSSREIVINQLCQALKEAGDQGMTIREIESLGGRKGVLTKRLAELVARGVVIVEDLGRGKAKRHYWNKSATLEGDTIYSQPTLDDQQDYDNTANDKDPGTVRESDSPLMSVSEALTYIGAR
ncbi:AAA family ATPase [Trueperella sp. LYQ143]|uniref:AAA family ATPase n=1 Tax=Trueperella sp. LYQ143 TaxID=3391059 RepID=UPI0039837344